MDWRNREPGQPDLPADAPILLVIHGLNGHSEEACVLYSMVCVLLPPYMVYSVYLCECEIVLISQVVPL